MKTHTDSLSQPVVSRIPPDLSDRVRIARFLCIFLMMFVHVEPGISANVYDRDAGLFDLIYFIFARLFGLSSVSLLSVVSGYFVVASLGKAGFGRFALSKARTLVVPLLAWNLLMLALLAVYGQLTGKWQQMPEFSVLGMADALLALTKWPLDVPLWFLRDLFVCCLLSPLLFIGLKRAPVIVMLVLGAYMVFGEDWLILQRPQLLLFFALGMWLRITGPDMQAIDRMARLLTVGLAIMIVVFVTIRLERVLLTEMEETLRLALDTLLRVTMAGGFWLLTGMMQHTVLASLCMRLEPHAFFLFCSHAILFHFAAIPLRRVFGNYGSDLFPITFFALPIAAVAAAFVGLRMIRGSQTLLFLFNAGHDVPSLTDRKPEREHVSPAMGQIAVNRARDGSD